MRNALVFRTFAALSSAAAAAALATPALAQATPRLSFAKSEAILGGAPSALEAILAEQRAIPSPPRVAPRPASYALTPRAATAIEPQRASAAALSGKPDVFGSVALRIGHTTLTGRWRRVESAGVHGAAARAAKALLGRSPVERLEAVNRYVNARVSFVSDERQHGRADVWSAAADTLRSGRGDCEDYAIAKLQMLRRAGFADRDLYLVIVKDLVSRSDHAVLVVRAEDRMYALDNGTDRLLNSDDIRDYRPILTFAKTGTWTHGYRVRAPEVQIASNEKLGNGEVAPAGDNQRSRSASLLALSTGLSR